MRQTARILCCCGIMGCLVLSTESDLAARQKDVEREQQAVQKKIDQTGILWVMPFSKVLDAAKSQNRIIAIKMIAFGTDRSGCW